MRFTVSKKIMSGFGILIIIIMGIGLLSMYQLSSVNGMLNQLYERELKGISYIKEAQVNLITTHRAEKNLILTRDPAEEARHIENIKKYNTLFEEAMKSFETTTLLEDIIQRVDVINELWEEAKPVQEKVIQLNSEQRYDETLELSNKNRAIFDKIEIEIETIANLKDQQAIKAYNDSDTIFYNTTKLLIIILITCVIIATSIGFYISKIISKPIVAMAKSAAEIANGDLTIDNIIVKNNDEIGELADSFNKMTDGLRDMIKQVVDASQTVAAYSEELSASSEETSAATEQVSVTIAHLSDNVTKQSEEIDAVSSNLAHISASIQQAAANTELVVNASMKASEAASKGVLEAANAVNKIDRVKQASIETANVIRTLEKQSEEIGQIVDVIKNIADQTNLLALNAAIEAARAGEQGRGFAVVAEEVRKLAEESSSSTQKISEFISNIQNDTHRAIDAIEVGNKEVYDGVEAVNKAGDSFQIIVKEIEGVVEQIHHISAATQEIASDSNEIVVSIDSIATISEDTSSSSQEVTAAAEEQTAAMEEIARSAQELAILAQDLQTTVSRFRY